MIEAPPVRRLLLGSALRQYRENLGYLLEDAARVLECDRSKISRIETGQRGIRPKELRELLTEYGVSEQEQGTLTALAQTGLRSNRYQEYGDSVPGPYREYLALEQAASDILIYEPQRLPHLLQTPEYLQASMAADLLGARTGSLAKLTLDRQKTLSQQRPRLTAVIGEAALRQMHGDAEVIRHQLTALAHVDERVIIQVLPSGRGAPPSGPATILRFVVPPGLGAVYLPALSGGICLVSQRDVANYIRAFERLRAAALTSAVSAQLIQTIAAGTNQGPGKVVHAV